MFGIWFEVGAFFLRVGRTQSGPAAVVGSTTKGSGESLLWSSAGVWVPHPTDSDGDGALGSPISFLWIPQDRGEELAWQSARVAECLLGSEGLWAISIALDTHSCHLHEHLGSPTLWLWHKWGKQIKFLQGKAWDSLLGESTVRKVCF